MSLPEVEVGTIAPFLRARPEELRRAIRRGELRGRIVGNLAYLTESTSRLLAWQATHSPEPEID